MLDIKFIRENKDIVAAGAKKKKSAFDVDALLALDDKRLALLKECEEMRAAQNKMSESIASTADSDARNKMIAEMKEVKESLQIKDEELKAVMKDWQAVMLKIPNIPSLDTPEGEDESGNVVLRSWGEKPIFDFEPKEHFEIGEALGLLDFETATKVAASRYAYIKGDLVRMQFALVQMCLDILTNQDTLEKIAKDSGLSSVPQKTFVPIIPPVFVKPVVQVKMARFLTPEEHYMFPNDDLMLVGSAEHTLGPMYMDHIFNEEELPIRYVGYSTSFRREAGSYGKDTKGILRQHQFDKLEMEVFSLPEQSVSEQNFLVAIQEYILQQLNLPYRVVSVCTGDMGFPDYRQIDIETWMPGQNKYRETQSADLTSGFQARRLNTRVKRLDGKIEVVHMNDATVLAFGRIMIAIMENFQQADGSIKIPKVLEKYMGKDTISL